MPARVHIPPAPWEVIETPYQPAHNIYFETNFTLGNGYMGARGCLEEGFPDAMERYEGTYLVGVFDDFEAPYVELVNVPELFATRVWVGESELNLQTGMVEDYARVLNMREGTLTRGFIWSDEAGYRTRFFFQRFLSLSFPHLCCQRFRALPLNHTLPIQARVILNGTVFNRRQRDYPPIKGIIPNYHLLPVACDAEDGDAWLVTRTKSTGIEIYQHARLVLTTAEGVTCTCTESLALQDIVFSRRAGMEVGFDKFMAVYTSREATEDDTEQPPTTAEMMQLAGTVAIVSAECGYDQELARHRAAWQQRWEHADIQIDGDLSAQQGIRFNIFHLIQANARNDARASMAAKLLSHTRYKGNAFWDTEIFMFPFFLYTDPQAARNLLLYRYHMLPGAREKARRLGLPGAMYPWMSAHDGSEQCDSWEYGDCEIHITADIAYAINQYLQVTGDDEFLVNYAAEIYLETARFWAARVAWNPRRQAYTLVTVKGPDEYCAITNNNMYTNFLAAFNLELAEEAAARLQAHYPKAWTALSARLQLQPTEIAHWHEIRTRMYQHWDRRRDLLIQDDTFLDLPEFDLTPFTAGTQPVLEMIGYERAMRVRILRQTDALLLMYLLHDRFTTHQKRACFRFYEPITTHDSSLSYNTHCIMSAELAMPEKAQYYFEKTCRLDLDDELDTARSGLHGASLGGTWQSIINGFAGVRVSDGRLSFKPLLPRKWQRLDFRLHFRNSEIAVTLTHAGLDVRLLSGDPLTVTVNGESLVAKGFNYGQVEQVE